MPKRNRPIVVSGSHRSGSTWVGRMIASAPNVIYVSELFNAMDHPDCPVRHVWHHVTAADAPTLRDYLRPCLELRYPWRRRIRDSGFRIGPILCHSKQAFWYWRRRVMRCRPLLKDPMALFSLEWLASEYQPDVVVLIRHPAAFACSLKRVGWHFPFHHLMPQAELMRTLLEPFQQAIHDIISQPDIIDHYILAWRLIHHVIDGYRRRHPDWLFVRHEDLSRNPAVEFENLFGRLGLRFTPAVRRVIDSHASDDNPRDPAAGIVNELKRNSKANISSWKHLLSNDEIARIRKGTADISHSFYSDQDWENPPSQLDAA